MPIVSLRNIASDVRIGLWRMLPEELTGKRIDLPFKSEARRLEYVCERLLLKTMFQQDTPELSHTDSGKPLLSNGQHISISHTKGYCVVMTSEKHRVGVDIERISNRVSNITRMFLRSDEVATDTISQLIHWCAKETIYKLFSEDHLKYEEMRVLPFTNASEGIVVVENLMRNVKTNVCFQTNDEYVLTLAMIADNELK